MGQNGIFLIDFTQIHNRTADQEAAFYWDLAIANHICLYMYFVN